MINTCSQDLHHSRLSVPRFHSETFQALCRAVLFAKDNSLGIIHLVMMQNTGPVLGKVYIDVSYNQTGKVWSSTGQ